MLTKEKSDAMIRIAQNELWKMNGNWKICREDDGSKRDVQQGIELKGVRQDKKEEKKQRSSRLH